MSTTKGNTYLQRLEQARCNGDWDSVPELSRKVQKHAPGRKCLAMTAATEARIQQLLPPPQPNASPSTIVSYIVSLDALQDALQEELDRSPSAATKLPIPSGGGPSPVTTADDLVQARVTIAWACMLKEEWEDVVKIIPAMEEVSEEWVGTGKSKDGYIEIARIKSLVLQGIALSHTNNKDLSLPLRLYRTAIRQAATLPGAQHASPSIREWTERALAHSALANYRCWLDSNSPSTPLPPATVCTTTPRKHEKSHGEWKTDAEQAAPSPVPSEEEDESSVGMAIGKTLVDEATVLSAFKAFHRFVSELPQQTPPTLTSPSTGSNPLQDAERREVYRHYFRFLSILLLPLDHEDAPYLRTLPSRSTGTSTVSLVNGAQAKLPNTPAGTPAQLRSELSIVQGIYEAYLLQTHSFPSADVFHSPIGEFVDIVCANWRTSGGSGLDAESVSECLYRAATKTFHSPRILRHLFYVLTSMGNLTDAVSALETYLCLSENAAERIAKGKIEKDFDPAALVLTTAVDGIRMLTKHLGEGAKALEIAGKCEIWAREWDIKDPVVLGVVYRGIGTANASWARQTVMGEKRSDILSFAKKAFEKGLKYDPEDIDAWYGISLVQADIGDTSAAIKSLRKALKRISNSSKERGRTAAVGHVLAILLSAQEEFEEAETICAKALVLLSPSDPTTLSVEEKALALELQMTSMALLEATSGPLAAVGGADALLTLYTRLFPPPLIPIPSRISIEPPSTAATKPSRPSTASRISRMFTNKPAYEKQYSISANDLSITTPKGYLPPVSRPGTAKLSRPGTATGAGLSQSVRVRQKSTYPSLRGAPKIRITTTEPPPTPGIESIPPSLAELQAAEKNRRGRRYSVSGGTIRRSRSAKSSYSSSTIIGGGLGEDIPPMPSSAEISTPVTPSGSGAGSGRASFSASRGSTSGGSRAGSGLAKEFGVGDDIEERERREGVMFSVLKSKLQRVHGNGTFMPSVNGSGSLTPSRNGNGSLTPSRNGNGNSSGTFTPTTSGTRTNGNTGASSPVSSISSPEEKPRYTNNGTNTSGNSPPKPKRKDISNNHPRSTPYPIATLANTIADEKKGCTISRQRYLPEPMLKEADERRRSEEALRAVWLFMAALYRRCGWLKDAEGAVEEAATVGGGWTVTGDGSVTEGGFGERLGTWGGWGGREGESAVSVERGVLAFENEDVDAALCWFESALAADKNCPGAVVGLSQILLDSIPAPLHPRTDSGEVPRKPRRPPFIPLKSETVLQEEELMRQAKHARALNLLSACTASPRGWDCSEAWYLLAEVLEKDGDVEGAKKALWRVVEIEDGRGLRALDGGAGVRVL